MKLVYEIGGSDVDVVVNQLMVVYTGWNWMERRKSECQWLVSKGCNIYSECGEKGRLVRSLY
jgi:hypothetical protein